MNLVYVDESGNTGLNLKDPQQPVFVLAALIVPESKWFLLEKQFFDIANEHIGVPLPYPFEVQAKDLKSGRGIFAQLEFAEQKENLDAAERSLGTLRLDSKSILKTTNIVEKGFFVDSSKSFALQLADLAAYYIRKYEENKLGFKVSEVDKQVLGRIEKLISTGVGSSIVDVLTWVREHYLKQK
jgi:hypothetical protein